MISMLDEDKLQEFFERVADKYTGCEICEILELTEWDVIEAFRELLIEKKESFEV